MLKVSLGLRCAVMCCAVTCWIETYHAALNCVVLYCLVDTSRPWYPNHDRTDLDLKLELPGSIARPQLVAVETCGVLNQLELKIQISSETGRTEKGRIQTETKRTEEGRAETRRTET